MSVKSTINGAIAGILLVCLILPRTLHATGIPDTSCSKVVVKKWTTAIKLAMFRMDLAGLTENVQKLKGICPPILLKKVCDTQCYQTLGQYYYFQAQDLKFLYVNRSLSVKEIENWAMLGINWVEEGLTNITQQIFAGTESESASDGDDSGDDDGGENDGPELEVDFHAFIGQMVGLKLLQTRLYLTMADAYYQAVANPYSQYLQFNSQRPPGSEPTGDSYMGLAYLYYQKAQQIILDAYSDLPRQSDPKLVNSVKLLMEDLQLRLASLSQGHIYLNINPMAVVNLSFWQLEAEIKRSLTQVKEVEGHISGYLTRSQATNENRANMELSDKRWYSEKQVAIKSQNLALTRERLSKLIQSSSDLAREMHYEDFKNRSAENQIRILNQFETTVLQLNQQTESLKMADEMSFLTEELSSAYDQRSEVRFKMSQANTMAHLKNEQDSLNLAHQRTLTQISNLQQEISKNDKQQEIFQNDISILELELEKLAAAREQLTQRRDLERTKRVDLVQSKIKKLEEEIKYYQEVGDNAASLCEVQESLQSLDQEHLERLAKCYTQSGTFCGGGVTESQKQLMKELLDKEKELSEQAVTNLQDEFRRLKATRDKFKEYWTAEEATYIATQAVVQILGGIYQVTSAIPATIISLAGGPIVDPARVPRAAYNMARDLAMATNHVLAREFQHQKEIRQLNDMMEKINSQIDAAKLQRDYTEYNVKKKLIEIGRIEAQYAHDLLKGEKQGQVIKLRCEGNRINNEWMIKRSEMSIIELTKEITLIEESADLLKYDLVVNDRNQKTVSLRIENYGVELEKLVNDRSILMNNLSNLTNSVKTIENQMQRLLDLERDLNNYTEENDQITQAISALKKNKLALMGEQRTKRIKQVEEMLRHHQEYFEKIKANLEKAMQDHAAYQGRLEEIRQQINNYQEQIIQNSGEILEAMTVTTDDRDERKKLLAILDIDMAQFTPSLSYWVEIKKRALQRANYYLSHYRIKLAYALLRPELAQSLRMVTGQGISSELDRLHDLMINSTSQASNVYLARFNLNESGQIVFDLNKRREVYFRLSDVVENDNPYLLSSPLFTQLYHKRVVDIRIGYSLSDGCWPNDDVFLNLSHVGIGQFNSKLGISSYLVSDEETKQSKLFFGTHEDNPALDAIKRRFDESYYRPYDLFNPSGHSSLYPWYGKGLNSLWRLSLPFDSVARERALPVCNGEPRTITDLYLYVWFSGAAYE
jgi:hypothetical protein